MLHILAYLFSAYQYQPKSITIVCFLVKYIVYIQINYDTPIHYTNNIVPIIVIIG